MQIVPLEKLTQVITSAQEPTSQRLTAAEEEARWATFFFSSTCDWGWKHCSKLGSWDQSGGPMGCNLPAMTCLDAARLHSCMVWVSIQEFRGMGLEGIHRMLTWDSDQALEATGVAVCQQLGL